MLSAGICNWLQIDNWLAYGVFAATATFIVYNGQRIFKSDTMRETPWLSWVKKYKKFILLLILLTLIVSIYCFFLIGIKNWWSIALLTFNGLISMFYVVRINGRNLREIPFIKIHLIALTWVSILIMFPIINEGIAINWWLTLLAFYSYIIAVTIPFDIRDLKYDMDTQLTLPQLIGVRGSKVLSLILLTTFYILLKIDQPDFDANRLFLFGVFITAGLIIGMNKDRGDLYCAGFIDGSIILIGLSFFY